MSSPSNYRLQAPNTVPFRYSYPLYILLLLAPLPHFLKTGFQIFTLERETDYTNTIGYSALERSIISSLKMVLLNCASPHRHIANASVEWNKSGFRLIHMNVTTQQGSKRGYCLGTWWWKARLERTYNCRISQRMYCYWQLEYNTPFVASVSTSSRTSIPMLCAPIREWHNCSTNRENLARNAMCHMRP